MNHIHQLIQWVQINNKMSAPKIISIEGNIGSGKSTFIKYLKKVFNEDEVVIVPEPVREWESIRDKDGKSMLVHFYEDQTRNAFSFQMMAYISRLAYLNRAIENNPSAKLIITERCLETDRNVFAKMLYDEGKIREVDYQIYLRWFDEFHKKLVPSYYIYIKASANICSERIKLRSRDGESSIPIEYLEHCGNTHDKWLCDLSNVHICDGSLSKEVGNPMWAKYINSILNTNGKDIKMSNKNINEVNYII